jgi:nucleotide-binding universal stress UspA family protein
MEAGRILVCLDGSPPAEAVLPLVTAIAARTGQRLMLLSVTEANASTEQCEAREAYLVRSERRLRDAGLEVATALMSGDPAAEILRAATALDASLIALATGVQGELVRWARGSVAETVLYSSTRPVLAARRIDTAAATQATVRRILVPLDGSALAESAIDVAVPLTAALDAELLLARVVPEYAAAAPGHQRLPEGLAVQQRQLEQAERYLAGKAMTLPASLSCTSRVLRGVASRELIALAQDSGVDLAVIASHGRTGLSRAIHGSVAADLLCAGLPALIVPQGATTAALTAAPTRAVREKLPGAG